MKIIQRTNASFLSETGCKDNNFITKLPNKYESFLEIF